LAKKFPIYFFFRIFICIFANGFYNITFLIKKKRKTMKKIVFLFVAFVAMSFAACGGSTEGAVSTDSTAVDSIEIVDSIDSVVVADSVIAE
jgi:hypothetical protein